MTADFVARRRARRRHRLRLCSNCTARTAICCRASCRRSPTCATTSTAAATRIARAFRSRCSAPIRAVWPEDRPISVRLSCHDWTEGGNTPEDAAIFAQHVQGGRRRPDRLLVRPGRRRTSSRSTAACTRRRSPTRSATRSASPTIAVGAISEADHANSIIAAGRADLCAIARPHLADPAWTLHEAAQDRRARHRLAQAVSVRQERSTRPTSRAPLRGRPAERHGIAAARTDATRWSPAPAAASARRSPRRSQRAGASCHAGRAAARAAGSRSPRHSPARQALVAGWLRRRPIRQAIAARPRRSARQVRPDRYPGQQRRRSAERAVRQDRCRRCGSRVLAVNLTGVLTW